MTKGRVRWRIPLAVLAVLAVGALVVAVWRAWTPAAEVNLADVVAVALAAATAVGAVVAWARRSTAAAVPTDPDVETAAQVLAGLVERQWHAEARHRLLDDPEPIPVQWQLTTDQTVMSHSRLIAAEGEPLFAGRSDDIARMARDFRVLIRRRLVITGGAGMGKTTLAVQLLLHLLATRQKDRHGVAEGEIVPVPVLLPVSGWDLDAHPRLQDWLTVRLAQDYPALAAPQLGVGAAAALAEGGHILPVLDGLDEIADDARARVIEALNASLTAADQLILTSRTAEFATAITAAGRPLNAAAVITPKLLTPQATADYLTACLPATPRPAWQQVLAALRSRAVPGLSQLAATPLGLWLIRTVYLTPGADPTPLTGLLGGDAAALRAHLLDELIPALIATRPPSTDPADHFRPRRRLDPDATRRYLAYLARAFPPEATRDIAWWHIARTANCFRLRVRLAAGLLFGLAAGLTGGLMFGIADGFRFDLWLEFGPGTWFNWALDGWLRFGIAFGVAAGVASGITTGTWVDHRPGYASLHLSGRTNILIRSIKRSSLTYGLVLGLVLGVAFLPQVGIATAFLIGFGTCLAAGFTDGLIEWSEQPSLTSTSTPRSSWRADKTLTFLRAITGLVVGLTLAAGFALMSTPGLSLGEGLVFGLLGGLVLGLAYVLNGSHHAWLAWALSRSTLAFAHRLPWQIMDFLDDVHRLGLLRAVGPVYQFRHAALHDHLAAADNPR
ncbi:NACHT domain-containing protein [Planotetraspora silvatica]|uniref:NACHT domain-containing protein n=1 Tax=Planotetraspora silvatica TaxID=234614 RepID=A0A8J3XN85_9ACTN|nr:NACHT domain-containing protein [Planotetraspora silvatica]GII46985.1 NACHT domain-containing protein [Planotetraspora silvatica]